MTIAIETAHQNVDSGEAKIQQTQAIECARGRICNECDGDGPPKCGFWWAMMRQIQTIGYARGANFLTDAMETAHQNVDSGKRKCDKNSKLCTRAGQICDECGGNGPPKMWISGERKSNKHKQLCRRASKFVTIAIETLHQNVDSGCANMQQTQAIVWARGQTYNEFDGDGPPKCAFW